MAQTQPDRFFSPFRFDPVNQQLFRGEHEIPLRRKTFEVLRYLVDHHGQLVTKAALLDAVWAEVAISDSMPAICVGELRKALGDQPKAPHFIETVHGRGYRFIAKLTEEENAPTKPLEPPVASTSIIVGRDAEMALLGKWFSQTLQGQRQIVFATGEAGIGKTAFVQTFLNSIATEYPTARIGRGQCVQQYGAGEPYMPFLEALGRLCREPNSEWIVERLQQFAPTWLAQMPGLLTSLERERSLGGETQGVTQQRMLREMVQALEALAGQSPLLLLLEDLHWSDFSTLELISAIARRSEAARLMILGTYRIVEMLAGDHRLRTMKEELEVHHYCKELRLDLLSKQSVGDYLERRFSTNWSHQFASLATAIHRRTDGNPLFMVNAVDFLVDSGFIIPSGDQHRVEQTTILSADRIEVPSNIRKMIEHNLDRLKPEEQAVLERASVAGEEFSAAAVAAAIQQELAQVEKCCTKLSLQEQFIRAGEPIRWPDGTVAAGFRFRHSLYQEVLYGRVPAGLRLQLHRRIAEREEAGHGDHAPKVAAELAHHYLYGNDKDKAVKYLQLAAEQALGRGAVVEAQGQYNRALALLSESPHDIERDRNEFALQMGLGSVLWSSKRWPRVETNRAFARAMALAEKLEKTDHLLAVLLGLGFATISRGEDTLARELGEKMLIVAEQRADAAALCAAHSFLGQALTWCGRLEDAQTHLELGSNYYNESDPSGFAAWGIECPALAAYVVLLLGFPERARRLMSEGLRRLERRIDPLRAGTMHLWCVGYYSLLRDAEGVHAHARGLSRLAAEHSDFTSMADFCLGDALMIEGRWAEAITHLRRAIDFNLEIGLLGLLPPAMLDQAQCLAGQGRLGEAIALVDEAIPATDEMAHLKPPALQQRANLLAQTGTDPSVIEAAYLAAIDCARSQRARYHELQATTSFCRWLNSHQRAAEARVVLSKIYDCFHEGFDTFAFKEAKALLDKLKAKERKSARRPG